MIWGAATNSLGKLLPTHDVPGPEGYLFSESNQQVRLQQVIYYHNSGVYFILKCYRFSISSILSEYLILDFSSLAFYSFTGRPFVARYLAKLPSTLSPGP